MAPRKALALRHVGFEDLGSFAAPLREAGYDVAYVDVADRDPRSLDPLGADLLVVLGGPISVHDGATYPFVTGEIELLRVRLAADRPTLGICLGAQMIAAALGARVHAMKTKEIGWSELHIHGTVAPNPLVSLENIAVLHWHGDMFDLPDGATLLASSPACAHQAFARGPNILGLQFHPEVLWARFEYWLIGHASELSTTGINPVRLREDAARYTSVLENAGAALLTRWLAGLED